MNIKKLLSLIGFIKKDKKTLLLDKIIKTGFPEKEVFVSVADFFDGNNDTGSIGANIYPDPPSIEEFRQTLSKIENDVKTTIVLIRIADV
jgi:hypothetical protein